MRMHKYAYIQGARQTGVYAYVSNTLNIRMYRVSGRLGWATPRGGGNGVFGLGGSNPEHTRTQLEDWVPEDARVEVCVCVLVCGCVLASL